MTTCARCSSKEVHDNPPWLVQYREMIGLFDMYTFAEGSFAFCSFECLRQWVNRVNSATEVNVDEEVQ